MQPTIKTLSGRILMIPTDEEETAIQAAIALDQDTREIIQADMPYMRKPVGRPISDQPKEKVTIRLSPDVVAAFRLTGSGWQTRIDIALREWLDQHP